MKIIGKAGNGTVICEMTYDEIAYATGYDGAYWMASNERDRDELFKPGTSFNLHERTLYVKELESIPEEVRRLRTVFDALGKKLEAAEKIAASQVFEVVENNKKSKR